MARPLSTGGKTSKAKARNTNPAKGRKTAKPKRRIAPVATRAKRGPASGPSKDLKEAREQQAATAEILKVIASSPSDVQPVFDAIAERSNRLINSFSAAVFRFVDGVVHLAAITSVNPAGDKAVRASYPRSIGDYFAVPQAGEVLAVTDTESYPDARLKNVGRIRGFRSIVYVPLKSAGTSIGAIGVGRKEPGPFAPRHVALLQTFADQAVIAIENARLLKELRQRTSDLSEALTYQTGSSNILSVIASSPTDVAPVLKAIVDSAAELCDAYDAAVMLSDGDFLRFSEHHGSIPIGFEKWPINRRWTAGRAFMDQKAVHLRDLLSDEGNDFPDTQELARHQGHRSVLSVPLLRENESIGVISLRRTEVQPFSDKQIALLQTFADQAVIAIENARLFNETQEALERQTATADILKVISSSPDDVQPVFEAIAERAKRLVGAHATTVLRVVGDRFELGAFTPVSEEADATLRASFPLSIANNPQFEMAYRGEITEVTDTESEMYAYAKIRDIARARGFRSRVLVPLRSDNGTVGAISVTRTEPGSFAAHHVQLLQTFADQAVIAIQNVRLFNETKEALERQTATADILKVIASSPSDVQPVFDAIVTNAVRLSGGFSAGVYRFVDDNVHLGAFTSINPVADETLRASFPRPIGDLAHFRTAQQTGKVFAIPDTEDQSDERLKDIARARGFRSLLHVPLKSGATSIGTVAISRKNPGPFSAHHVELLQTFADQAVIAIENVRLFNETKEALARQTATADVLKVIASSPADIRPVFDAIAERSKELIGGHSTTVIRYVGDMIHLGSFTPTNPEADAVLRALFPRPIADDAQTQGTRLGEIAQIVDTESESIHPEIRSLARARGWRSRLFVPLKDDNDVIGLISVTRKEPGSFADKDVELLRTFADQAVIAIQNVELFEEVQAKTRDLEESLQQQTATADVLKVISRSAFDLEAVLNTLVESAVRLSGGSLGTIFQRRGELFHLTAAHGYTSEMQAYGHANPLAPGPGSTVGRTAMTGTVVQIPDVTADPDYTALGYQRVGSFRAMLGIPIMREGKVEGVFSLAKPEPGPFGSRQVELVQTFADQAIIAIENVRLFDEVEARTRELTEALEQQTATAEVLSVISSSTGNLAPVFDAMLRKAMELCGANFGVLNMYDGKAFTTAAAFGLPPAYDEYRRKQPLEYGPNTAPARLLQGEPVVEITDLLESDAYRRGDLNRRALVDIGGARCLLAVPLLKDERVVGNVMIFRQENRPFSEKQITLLQQFAAQAVIAIENTRLLRELRESTEDLSESLQQQTATAEVLKAISRSTFDLPAVLHALVETASRLCEADKGTITRQKDGQFFRAESYGFSEQFMNYVRGVPVVVDCHSATGRALLEGIVVHIPDVETDPDYTFREGQRLGDFRSLLGVPMLRERIPIGVITLTRTEPRAFTDKQIELAITFADQAAIAIENVRLFDEVQTRTLELAQSLEDLGAAQDRLVQTEKLASLGQLTAGIAHEIKNPLNFVNNFSALSAELTDELNDVLKPVAMDGKVREEVDELTGMLKDNLKKVVQHGKRADSIVKNMLLHSREGSREHRPADINSLLDESLNLAYHGARAEKGEFNITLQRDFDADAGTIELFPQEITRAFLNLIANGVYAATRRKTEEKEPGFEPTLRATTKNLGNTVEIRIRDNGTGIPAEVQEKMFNPFFTTKPAGEGTGLGLSMTHDIIVKQHGGRIDVATEPGQFTEFTIVLPRNLSGDRGET